MQPLTQLLTGLVMIKGGWVVVKLRLNVPGEDATPLVCLNGGKCNVYQTPQAAMESLKQFQGAKLENYAIGYVGWRDE